jgi:hypothetical protein
VRAFVTAPSRSAQPVWRMPSNERPSKIVRMPGGSAGDRVGSFAPVPAASSELIVKAPCGASSTRRNSSGASSIARPVIGTGSSR